MPRARSRPTSRPWSRRESSRSPPPRRGLRRAPRHPVGHDLGRLVEPLRCRDRRARFVVAGRRQPLRRAISPPTAAISTSPKATTRSPAASSVKSISSRARRHRSLRARLQGNRHLRSRDHLRRQSLLHGVGRNRPVGPRPRDRHGRRFDHVPQDALPLFANLAQRRPQRAPVYRVEPRQRDDFRLRGGNRRVPLRVRDLHQPHQLDLGRQPRRPTRRIEAGVNLSIRNALRAQLSRHHAVRARRRRRPSIRSAIACTASIRRPTGSKSTTQPLGLCNPRSPSAKTSAPPPPSPPAISRFPTTVVGST